MSIVLQSPTKNKYQVVLDTSGNGNDDPMEFPKIYYRKRSYQNSPSPFWEFNVGPRIGFIPFQLTDEEVGNPLENRMFQDAEIQVGPCDLIPI
jgi:hypothetical protein